MNGLSGAAPRSLNLCFAIASEAGRRPDNQDFAAARVADDPLRPALAAVADGVGGRKGGRTAAELAVRSFVSDYWSLPETLDPRRAASRLLASVNSWIYAQGRVDPALAGMACTFSGLIFDRRTCHVLHVGDSRVYRYTDGHLERLTQDHVAGRGDYAHMLTRAVGFEDSLRLDYAAVGLQAHDRLLICTDGVFGPLDERSLKDILAQRSPPQDAARQLVDAALSAGGSDNATALVVDVIDLPPARREDLASLAAQLPIEDLPALGDVIDGYELKEILSDGRYSRLFRAREHNRTRDLALKFPHPRVASDAAYRSAFVREAWVAARVRSLFVGEIVELPPGRASRLYSVMPYYDGETLEQRLKREPRIGLAEGVSIATKISRGLVALHRSGIIHRDVKPDNIVLTKDGGLRLIDLGVALVPHLDDGHAEDIPGTPSYMAPELFQGAAGDEASDLYALGVAIYRLFSRAYPYGEVEPFSKPRFGAYAPLSKYRPDLPPWLDAALSRAVALEPSQRYGDVVEFALELENGALLAPPSKSAKRPFYERNPLLFWKLASAALLIALVLALAIKSRGH